jgi:predicted RNase H-like HicB family nuclease
MPQQSAKRRTKQASPKPFKIIVEKHRDGYVAYPLGVKGVVVGERETYDEAMTDVRSAIRAHIETFGETVLTVESPVLEAFVAETEVGPWWASFPERPLNGALSGRGTAWIPPDPRT